MKMRKFVVLFAAFLLCACVPGSDSEPIHVTGVVAYPNGGPIVSSYIRDSMSRYDDEVPIANESVTVSFDREGARPVPNMAAKSDEQGEYRIEAIAPDPKETDNQYFIHVSKAGYEPLVSEIRLGPFARFTNNAVILKPITSKFGRGKE